MPWHRFMLLEVEKELRRFDARVTLPYWDWTRSDSRDLDAEPWKSFFGGRSNTGGRFDNWNYNRSSTPVGGLPNLDQIIDEVRAATFTGFRAMECSSHGQPHNWTGGTMAGGNSPLDPLFYLHHCNVDRLWAMWQRNHTGLPQYTLEHIPCDDRPGGDEAKVPLNSPMIGGATPASMLDHTALGYFYHRDDALEARVLERGLPAIASGDVTTITLETPQVIFNDVPEGETTQRAALFSVNSCESLSFHVTSGPTAPFTLFSPGPFMYPQGPLHTDELRVWVLYTGGTPGSSDAGVMTVVARNEFGDELQRWENIPILANSVARPKVAVVLVLDESGSMLEDAGNNRKRLQVLQFAATTFVDQLFDDNGLAMVSFADTAEKLTDLEVVGALNSSVRNNARQQIDDHGPPDLFPHTSIGAGLEAAADVYDNSPISGNFDVKATVVFTDGFENRSPFIRGVSPLINERVYAVGVADAANVQNDILRALADNTGGYILVTGALAQDDEFLLDKFFIQILAGVTNQEIIRDPDGTVMPGEVSRVPFSIVRSDIAFDAVALTRTPGLISVALEAPDGTLIGIPQVPPGSFRSGATSQSFRITLPLVVNGVEYWEGEWKLLLFVNVVGIKGFRAFESAVVGVGQFPGVPYRAMIHCRSNLRLRAGISQSAPTPGANLHLRAVITEYGQPIETHPNVMATMVRPDHTTA
ncbi:MAG: tyrosinase family protein, partial [Methylocella sp.]